MLALSYPGRWRATNIFMMITILALTMVPAFWATDLRPGWLALDKWMHGLTFAFLALWYTGQYARASYWLIALGLLLYGAIIEIGQSMIPYRTAEWGDLAADLAGIAAGILIAIAVTGEWSLRAENWIKNRLG